MNYILQNPEVVLRLTMQHFKISFVAVLASILIGVPIGILLTRYKSAQGVVMAIMGILYTIPSLALFAMLIPLMGLGFKPTLVALILYSQLAIIRNTVSGIETIDANIIEAARGMGMNARNLLFMVELPLGLPVIMAGVRMITGMAIGVATIASYIGAGGLGDLVFLGMFTVDANIILAGAIPICVMALLADHLLVRVQRRLELWRDDVSPGLSGLVKEG